MKAYRSYSSEETKRFGAKVARWALRQTLDRYALILALKGDLGSGKTTFVQGFLKGLSVRKRVNSPTFVLVKRFTLRNLRFSNVYHLDCYRLKKAKELLSLGLKEILNDPKNIVLVEWPDKISKQLPKNTKKFFLRHGSKENERLISN